MTPPSLSLLPLRSTLNVALLGPTGLATLSLCFHLQSYLTTPQNYPLILTCLKADTYLDTTFSQLWDGRWGISIDFQSPYLFYMRKMYNPDTLHIPFV